MIKFVPSDVIAISVDGLKCLRRNKFSLLESLAAIAIVVLAFDVAFDFWSKHPEFLVIGRDGRLAVWLAQQGYEWNSPFSLTTVNPYQGAGSMLLPINAVWIPGAWPILGSQPSSTRFVLSEVVYASELVFSVALLARVLGHSRVVSVLVALFCAALLFPPFNFYFGLQGWLATAPIYAHTIALFSLMYATLLLIGHPISANKNSQIAFNSVLILVLVVLLQLLFFAAPFWNAGMLVGGAVGLACIGLSSPTRGMFFWRLGAGIVLLVWAVGSGMLNFLTLSLRYSVRFLSTESPDSRWVDWSVMDQFSWQSVLNVFCNNGIGCTTQMTATAWPMPTLLHLQAWFIGGSILVALLASAPQFRRLAAIFAFVWLSLLVFWVTQSVGLTKRMPIEPVYTYLPLYPLLALMAIGGVSTLIARLVEHLAKFEQVSVKTLLFEAGGGLILLLGVAHLAANTTISDFPSHSEIHQPIVAELRNEIAISPGDSFRGSVVSVFGSPDGDMMRAAGYGDGNSEPDWQMERYFGLVSNAFGTSLSLLDMWELDIPTLEEYGQNISPVLELYERAFFESKGQDSSGRYFVFVRTPNLPILESLGVRFVFIDSELSSDRATLRAVLPVSDEVVLRLYELDHPNLGTYSPTNLIKIDSASAVIKALLQTPEMLKKTAMIATTLDLTLQPAEASRFEYVRDGLQLSASSSGQSAILLPVQYSNCMEVEVEGPGKLISVTRANLLHTLAIFSGEVTIQFRWKFESGNSDCREHDIDELNGLGVIQAIAQIGAEG